MSRRLVPFTVAASLAALASLLPLPGTHDAAGLGENDEFKARIEAIKKAAAENMASLRQYTWLQRTTLYYKGEIKNVKDQQVRFGPNGKLEKTLISSEPEEKKKGGLRGKIVEKKVGDLKEYMERVGGVIEEYVPPVPAKMQAAFQAEHVMFGSGGAGLTRIEFRDYVTAGDLMTMKYDMARKKLRTLDISTFVDEKDPVTLDVVFKTLPDSTNYASVAILKAEAKKIEVRVEDFDHRKVSP